MPVGYGKRIRQEVQAYKCPSCSRNTVRRFAPAIWVCSKCKAKFASGTFEFKV
ncbi:MAG: hypothetical protein HYT72_01700 [Candidatus Aenigmarchaeota archaeon]|nr:hypothetical protein [Candidatus Aenigmarchaeota archaeon]